jgi:hypothetical protein
MSTCLRLFALVLLAETALAQPAIEVDLLGLSLSDGFLSRVHGSAGDGSFGVPVAGGHDCDGDGLVDTALAAFLASPLGRTEAGEVYLVFGDGTISGALDTATVQARILRFAGVGTAENAGSEIWMDDVTGDGVGDLLIARQNFTVTGRIGAGALSIVVGGADLKTHAATLQRFDLGSPPLGSTMTTVIGPHALARLGMWMRTGDFTGDGIADIVVGADQQTNAGEIHAGVVYLIRGGAHLDANQTIDLASFGATAIDDHLARITPPAGSSHHHFGATVEVADLDGNDRAEVLIATGLNRAGGSRDPAGAPGTAHGSGGSPDGSAYIVWDDNIPAGAWAAGLTLSAAALPGTRTLIHGGVRNVSFGEEMVGGRDYDDDGTADLFIGDLAGDGSIALNRPFSGMGHVIYDVASLKGLTFNLDALPVGLVVSTFVGAASGNILGDTAMQGDYDDDGIADLGFSAPHGSPPGRTRAGIVYILFGRAGPWPSFVDLLPASIPPPATLRMAVIHGALGADGSDAGDTLAYSAAGGDVDGDGRPDVIVNEMQGNGTAVDDVGNVIVVSGRRIAGQVCPLDVDQNGAVAAPTDGVYVFGRLLGLGTVVPSSFRTLDPSIAPDSVVGANIDALGERADVDDDGSVEAATDGVYIFRRMLGLAAVVPAAFRDLDPTIPSDEVVGANVDAMCE